MSFLLDTNICSEYLRRPSLLFHRFVQHSGRLHISSVSLSELFTWAYRQHDPSRILATIGEFGDAVQVLPFDAECAEVLGRIRGEQFRTGGLTSPIDLMIGVTALVHDLTLVTHNTKDFERIENLRMEDWLA
jgi:tRNA(fMet)-specific endonuclease VapC